MSNSARNNFNLLRLMAAMQVLLTHTIEHLKIQIKIPGIEYFPGLLVFFSISGFLMWDSLLRNSDLNRYFRNRFLRIYPALWVSFLVTLLILILFRIIALNQLCSFTILKWVLAQITVFQFWTPSVLRNWGVGTPNGSLWTIPVEIGFYVFLPLIAFRLKKVSLIIKFTMALVLSLVINILLNGESETSNVYLKLVGVSLFPYLLYFLFGVLIREYWHFLKDIITGKFKYWLILFLALRFTWETSPQYFPDNFIGFVMNVILTILTISFAYSLPKLHGFMFGLDISFGVYIYHMLIVNTLYTLGCTNDLKYLYFTVVITVAISSISWFLIEKPLLSMKK
jgi:peptidoglycan/LPS O-acetylase OafA/YrhL